MIEEKKQKGFWTHARFLVANAGIVALLLLGLRVTYVSILRGAIGDFWISAPVVWYASILFIWWLIIAK